MYYNIVRAVCFLLRASTVYLIREITSLCDLEFKWSFREQSANTERRIFGRFFLVQHDSFYLSNSNSLVFDTEHDIDTLRYVVYRKHIHSSFLFPLFPVAYLYAGVYYVRAYSGKFSGVANSL